MTNTVYFEPSRDDASASTSSDVSQQLSIVDQEKQSVSSSLYSVIGKAISALGFQRSGVHPGDISNDVSGYESSGILSSASGPPTPHRDHESLQTPSLMKFSFKELKNATSNFRLVTLLGEGSFGKVFKGWIDDKKLIATKPGRGIAVAVKILNVEGFQGHNEWLAEVKYLGKLYHPNLVRLYGYCLDDQEHLLVYEYMPRGSLNNHLFRKGSSSSSSFLSWSIRMKIALGAAKGLAFLHRPYINVIHRGVQCSNILLDSDYNAKLSGFGFARDGPSDDMNYVSTRVVGTAGYGAPEYIMTGHLTTKCDVYCFGVVLLELFSGQGALGYKMRSGEFLLHWAKPHLNSGKINRVLDSYLGGQYSWESAEELAKLTLKCLDDDPKLRPNMDEVVTFLEQLQELQCTEKKPQTDIKENHQNSTDKRTAKKFGREAREAGWATKQKTFHGLQNVESKHAFGDTELMAEAAKRHAEMERLREITTLKGHVESIAKLKGLDINMNMHYTV